MLVTHIVGNCPECDAKNSFGNVSVGKNSVLRGCTTCNYKYWRPLPSIKKKVLYLDQFFFSNAFKENDPRFIKSAKKIKDLAAMQSLVAPFSSLHEDEANQWRGYAGRNKEDLMDFIKKSSRGREFKPHYKVEETQVIKSFLSFLSSKSVEYQIEESDVLADDIHTWENYIWIDVGRYTGDIELKRKLKQQSVEELINLFPKWRKSQTSFEQDVGVELQSAVKGYIESYYDYIERIFSGDFSATFNAPIISMVIESLTHCLPSEMPYPEKFKKIGEFFQSDHFKNIPYNWLSCRMFAALKDQVKNGAYRNKEKAKNRLSGVFLDINHISLYAPYCDAFVMDKSMASLVSDPRIDLEGRYGVRVFSLSNWNEFLDWLDVTENSISAEQKMALKEVYPD